jgi:hypothetical protein
MIHKKRHLIVTIAGAIGTLYAFWVGGHDFDTRGQHSVLCYLVTLFVAAICLGVSVLSED